MPSASEILRGLQQIADDGRGAAILWHGALLALLIALGFGLRPRQHHARVALSAPLASVSVFAWSYSNPFNGMIFAIAAAVLAMLGAHAPSESRVSRGSFPSTLAGVALIGFGWVYPHFLSEARWWRLLYETPLGLLPCPTLSVVVGLALLGGGLGSSAWSLALSALGFFYGAFGALYLGAQIDWVLCAGSMLLALSRRRSVRAIEWPC